MGRRKEELQVNIPSYFRCPISLDVMKSPVSLCTGMTYDRSSIERWLEAGNNTCPATMQVLPSTDLVPNHTLHRLIQLWSNQSHHHTTTIPPRASQLLHQIHSSPDPLPPLRLLASSASADLAGNAASVPILNAVLTREPGVMEVKEAAVRVLAPVLAIGRNAAAAKSMAEPRTVSAIVSVLGAAENLDSRIDAARVLESIASVDAESRLVVAGAEGAMKGMTRLVMDETRPEAIDAGLSCLVEISAARRVRAEVVGAGAVAAAGRALARAETGEAVAEKAMRLLEVAATCAEGRAAICEEARGVVGVVVGRMMKLTREGRERAVVVLWSVCHLYADRRALRAVADGNGLTKILVLMQSGCSAPANQMARDLLRIFRINSKTCLPNYDSKTAHIMPF